jgi:ATP phosphoribosyltransferase
MTLRIALQSKGRLLEGSLEYLKKSGLDLSDKQSKYSWIDQSKDIEIVFLRDDDIPELVSRGLLDFGVIGYNEVLEKNPRIKICRHLNFAQCKLVLAVPETSRIKAPEDLNLERIFTSYPQITNNYLIKKQIKASVIPFHGSVEITPELGLADAISDLTQSGKTLEEHNLRVIDTILKSTAVLIESSLEKEEKRNLYNLL